MSRILLRTRYILNARHLPWVAAMLIVMRASIAWADTTGGIEGTVVDTDGLPVPGVSVVLESPSGTLGGAQTKLSTDDGIVKFNSLLPGSYNLTATKDGFKATTVTGVQVLIDRTATVSIEMQSGGATEVIEVVDKRQTVDVNNVTRGEVLTKDFLSKIPAGRTYQTAVQMAAGVVGGAGGNPNMGGGASNENTYMLDGVNITDPVTGTFSLNFNYDAIQQIEVMLGGYEPEYSALGGVVNLVTESGTNNLQFDTSAYYQNGNWAPKMDARYSADGYQVAPTGFDSSFQTFELSAKVAGPVIRDKAWFIFSYSGVRSLINNVGVDLPRDYEAQYVLGKFTVQPNSEHRLTAFVQMDPTTIDNINQGGGRVRPEAQGRQVQGGAVTQMRWQWFLSPNSSLDTQVTYQRSFIEQNGVPCTHDRQLGYNPCKPGEAEGDVDWNSPGRFGVGGAYDSVNFGYFYFDDRSRYEASSKLSMLAIKDPLGGTHDLKFGADASQQIQDQLQGYTGNTEYIDINLVPYDPQSFQNYYWLETTGPIKFRSTASMWSLFAQDAWKPVPTLTLKYGLRYDHSIVRNDIGEPVIQSGLVAPRAYAAWDPTGDGKSKIAGGYGRFNGTGNLEVASFTSVSSFGDKLFLGEYFNGGQGAGFVNGPSQMYDIAPLTNPNTRAPNIRTPRIDEFILLMQRQLVQDVSVGANLSQRFTRTLFEFDETNVTYDQDGSAVIGSRIGDSFKNVYRLRTPVAALRNYTQFDVYLDKVESRRWAGRITYTYARSTGTSRASNSGSFANDPQTQYNYGPLIDTDIRHQLKGYAYWSLPTDPWTQNIGVSLQYYSGQPFERWYWDDEAQSYGIRIRPRATYGRLPGWWNASVKFSQEFDVKKGKVVADIEANNIFNLRAPTDLDSYYVSSVQREFVLYRQDPLQLQVGVEYRF